MTALPLLEVAGLVKRFPVDRGFFLGGGRVVRAVDGVDLTLGRRETLGLVGESGCGKSTLGRAILRLVEPDAGRLTFDGIDLLALSRRAMRPVRRRMQIVFQDPYASLNPRMRVGSIVAEGIKVQKIARGTEARERALKVLQHVGLGEEVYDRYPHEFSGGQRQRIGIARALAVEPELIVADEPVSALDASVQAQIVNLLLDLQDEMGLSYLFISHDLRLVRGVSDRVAVMYLGKIVETAPTADLFRRPLHPYTRALMSAVPVADPARRRNRILLAGEPPSPVSPPPGCSFHPRCPFAVERCRTEVPPLEEKSGGHRAACHLSDRLPRFVSPIAAGARG